MAETITREELEKLCDKFLDDFICGTWGLSATLEHPIYLRLSKCIRRLIEQRELPLFVIGSHGRVDVSIDPAKLTVDELARYNKSQRQRTESILYDGAVVVEWPLNRNRQ